jgi:hypothetical protein
MPQLCMSPGGERAEDQQVEGALEKVALACFMPLL